MRKREKLWESSGEGFRCEPIVPGIVREKKMRFIMPLVIGTYYIFIVNPKNFRFEITCSQDFSYVQKKGVWYFHDNYDE